MEGKCPKNERQIPCFIIKNNEQVLVMTDGKGDCYMIEGLGFYEQLETKCIEENKVNPKDYEFDRFLSGFDF